MKRILFLSLIAITSFTFSASAQADGTAKKSPEERLQSQMKHLKKQLNLTAQQEVSVDSINRIFIQKAADARSAGADRKGKMQAVKQANEARNAAMKTVLTADQYTSYEKMQNEQKEKMKERRAGKAIQ